MIKVLFGFVIEPDRVYREDIWEIRIICLLLMAKIRISGYPSQNLQYSKGSDIINIIWSIIGLICLRIIFIGVFFSDGSGSI